MGNSRGFRRKGSIGEGICWLPLSEVQPMRQALSSHILDPAPWFSEPRGFRNGSHLLKCLPTAVLEGWEERTRSVPGANKGVRPVSGRSPQGNNASLHMSFPTCQQMLKATGWIRNSWVGHQSRARQLFLAFKYKKHGSNVENGLVTYKYDRCAHSLLATHFRTRVI